MVRKQVGSYLLGRTLGEGSYAKVKYAQHVETGEAVAIKMLDKEALLSAHMAAQVKREIEIMTRLHHPYIVDLREVFPTRDNIYMVMELVPGGELFDQIIANGPLQEDRVRKIFQQLMDGIDCCHRQGICHRDIKLENVLLDAGEPPNPKLSDFGLGALPDSQRDDGLLRTSCGTPNYVAPEVLSRRGYDGFVADLWSLGVCLYVMAAGKLPFEEANLPTLFRKIAKADYLCPSWFSPGLVDVLSLLLEPVPRKRATIARLRQHHWVRQGYVFVDAYPSSQQPLDEAALDLFSSSYIGDVTLVGSPEKEDLRPPTAGMNAFQLINAALDLSALFERRQDVVHRHTRFTSKAPPQVLLNHLQDAVQHLRGTVKRRDDSRIKMTVQGAKAPLTLAAEVLVVVPGVYMVEMTRTSGDVSDFYQLYALLSKAVIPALAKYMLKQEGKREESPRDATDRAAPPAGFTFASPSSPDGALTGQLQDNTRGEMAKQDSDQSNERDSSVTEQTGIPGHDSTEELGGHANLPYDNAITSRLAGTNAVVADVSEIAGLKL